MKKVFYSIRSRLILSLIGIALIIGGASLFIGRELLYNSILNEAKARVRSDLNAGYEILLSNIREIKLSMTAFSLSESFQEAVKRGDSRRLTQYLNMLERLSRLDFAGILTKDGLVLAKIGPTSTKKMKNPIFKEILEKRVALCGVMALPYDFLFNENPELLEKTRIKLSDPSEEGEVRSALALVSFVPLFVNGEFRGLIYGGTLLNKNYDFVDRIRDTIFQKEEYKGRPVGTVTLFLNDIRISTNVLTPRGERAIGTKVSKEVKEHVLEKGNIWIGRAFVVNDWYISAYKPLKDINDRICGMLYVGILEEIYTSIWRRANLIIIPITAACILFALFFGYYFTDGIVRPIRKLINLSREIQKGNLSVKIGQKSRNEVGILEQVFEEMVESLKEREKLRSMESEILFLKSEKQASIGRLAAGVAHEINNPLTGVLTYTHMLLKRKDIPDDVRADLEVIAEATERVRRIVKGLLTYSRETVLQKEKVNINELVRSTLSLLENQALIKGVELNFKEGSDIPLCYIDKNQFQSVIMNIVLNALDATQKGGSVLVETGMNIAKEADGKKRNVEITISDTGCGIPKEYMDKIFDPFFTTKEVGEGTGLGLAVALSIVQRHGGTIKVKSEVGKGSEFTIEIPVDEEKG